MIGYFQFTRSFVEEYNASAFRTAETAAAIVNADHIQDYLATGGDSDEYRTSLAHMNTLCQKQGVTLACLNFSALIFWSKACIRCSISA